jgi:hypothetical protein
MSSARTESLRGGWRVKLRTSRQLLSIVLSRTGTRPAAGLLAVVIPPDALLSSMVLLPVR